MLNGKTRCSQPRTYHEILDSGHISTYPFSSCAKWNVVDSVKRVSTLDFTANIAPTGICSAIGKLTGLKTLRV